MKLTQNNIIIKSFEEKGADSVKYKAICSTHFTNEDYSIWNDVGNRMSVYYTCYFKIIVFYALDRQLLPRFKSIIMNYLIMQVIV